MMSSESSPATEMRFEWRLLSSASPGTYGEPLAAPRTPEEADRLLSRVDELVQKGRVPAGLPFELARFLGANSSAWTQQNRTRLRRALAGLERRVIDPLIQAMRALPRTDVLDEAELVLRNLAPTVGPRLRQLVEERGLEPAVRACVLRALARSEAPGSRS